MAEMPLDSAPEAEEQPFKIREVSKNALMMRHTDFYQGLSPRDREAFMRDFMTADEEQQLKFMAKHLPGMPRVAKKQGKPIKEALKTAAADSLDTVGQVGGAYLGGPVGSAVGGIAANRANEALGLREKEEPLLETGELPYVGNVPITSRDILTAGLPLTQGAISGASRLLTRPAKEALRKRGDLVTAEEARTQTEIAAARRQAEEAGAASLAEHKLRLAEHQQKVAAHKQREEELYSEFAAKKQAIIDDAALTHRKKVEALQRTQREYKDALDEHTRLAQDLATVPHRATTDEGPFARIGGHSELYDVSAGLARNAGTADLRPLLETALQLKVTPGAAAGGLENRFPRAAQLLESIVTNPGAVSLEDAILLQRELGKGIGKRAAGGGEEYRIYSALYSKLDDIIALTAQQNPVAAKAVAAQKEASRRFMRSKLREDWDDMWLAATRPQPDGKVTINSQTLRNELRDNELNNRFWNIGWTAEERAALRETVEKAPTHLVGRPPKDVIPPVDTRVETAKLTRAREEALAKHRVSAPGDEADIPPPSSPLPDFSDVKSKVPPQAKDLVSRGETADSVAVQRTSVIGNILRLPTTVSRSLIDDHGGVLNKAFRNVGLDTKAKLQQIVDGKRPPTQAQRALITRLARKYSVDADGGDDEQ